MSSLATSNDCFLQTRLIIEEWNLIIILFVFYQQLVTWNEEYTGTPDSSPYCSPTFARD